MNVEMTEQEAQEFALWLRERANSLLERADRMQNVGHQPCANGATRFKRVPVPEPLMGGRTVTQDEFEQSVLQKSGRVYDVARRLGVAEEIIRGFLAQPNAKVSVQQRGWIKPKSDSDGNQLL